MPLSFGEYARLGQPQWRGQTSLLGRALGYVLGTPDMHTRIRNAHVCNLATRLPLPAQARVLDVGCGRGVSLFYLAGRFPKWRLTGLELDDPLIEACQRASAAGPWRNVSFVRARIEDLAEQASYDLALAIDVLEHIEDDLGMLRKLHRALRPGGYLIVHVPRYRKEQWRFWPGFKNHDFKDKFGHVRDEYQPDELQTRLARAGFAICEFNQTFGRRAEMAWELNNLLWEVKPLRKTLAILTYPVAMPLGYADTLTYQKRGNSFLVLAQKPENGN
jgi:SAM-dependent methyltransferase